MAKECMHECHRGNMSIRHIEICIHYTLLLAAQWLMFCAVKAEDCHKATSGPLSKMLNLQFLSYMLQKCMPAQRTEFLFLIWYERINLNAHYVSSALMFSLQLLNSFIEVP